MFFLTNIEITIIAIPTVPTHPSIRCSVNDRGPVFEAAVVYFWTRQHGDRGRGFFRRNF